MAFLLAGFAIGSAIALSAAERDMYYTTRTSYSFIGTRNGMDVYRDRVTGVFYVDDRFDVQKVGTPGWSAHPVDVERLKKIFAKYSPEEIPWVEFTLAMYAGKEMELWKRLYFRFERPQKPKKPTAVISDSLSRKVRKTRWEEYDQEYKEYEARRAEADAKFRNECQYWDNKKKEYQSQTTILYAQNGKFLLQRALSASNVKVRCKVPFGKASGDSMIVSYLGKEYQITIPPGAAGGQEIDVVIPLLQPSTQVVNGATTEPRTATAADLAPITPSIPRENQLNGESAAIPPPAIGKESSKVPESKIALSQSTSRAEPPVPTAISEIGKSPSLPRVNSFEFSKK